MIQKTFVLATLLAVATTYSAGPVAPQNPPSAVLYEGARLIAGNGSQPIASAAMLVENGIITRVGTKGSVNASREALRVDLTGKTVIPALIDTHGHPGFQRGLTYSADNFNRETIVD